MIEPAALQRAFDFWKPLDAAGRLAGLVTCGRADDPPAPGVRVLRSDAPPTAHRLVRDGAETLLFAAVAPLAAAADPASVGAESLAQIRDADGEIVSAVLWYPEKRCVVLPFDPDEAIDALRFERYMAPSKKTVLPRPVLSAYYAVRPLIPKSLKLLMRRAVASTTDASNHPLAWPADDSCDELLRLQLEALLRASGEDSLPFVWLWPDGRPWAVVLTHDVETAEGLANVPRVMALEREYGVRSSFNLVPADYEADEVTRERITRAGFELGVHGWTHDGLLFSNPRTFLARAEKILATARAWGAVGFRSPATYRELPWLHELGVEYDSSVTDTAPFEPQPGGCGSLFPYLVDRVVEMPMTLPQDHTLFGLLGQTDAHVWLDKLARVRRAHGMACVLAHPDPAGGYIGLPENEAHYQELLAQIATSDAWVPLPRELASWWRARDRAQAAQADALPGAAIAHARLGVGGRLEFVVPGRDRDAAERDLVRREERGDLPLEPQVAHAGER